MFKKLKKLNKTKSIIITSTLVIVLVAVVGTTVAWLTSRTNFLTNTFTYGDIKISIVETDTNDGDEDASTNSYVIIPGTNITKDTKVLVKGKSEDCYLFVKVEKENDFDKYMTYSVEDKWTQLDGYEDVYYMEVEKNKEDQTFSIIKDNVIKVKEEITSADVNNIEGYPTLTINAYAVQRNQKMEDIDSPEEAWLLAYNPAS